MEHKQQHVSVAFATEQQQFHITVDFMNGNARNISPNIVGNGVNCILV